jgi:hypothetical protein
MLRAINRTVPIVALCLAFGATTAFADHHNQAEAREHGYEHGYRDGFHRGIDDVDHGNKFKPEVKDADQGYEKSMGDKDQYKNGYRSGFVSGYEDAFNHRPGRFGEIYGPADSTRGTADREDFSYQQSWSGSHVAADMGYRDGLMAGEADYNHHHSPRAEDQDDYRHADHGYRSSFGEKSIYQQQYRDGFMAGYRDAYSGRR